MSWGVELWDQFDTLSSHTQKGIEFLEKYGHFIRDRCVIEKEYATKLRKLVKTYHPKKKDEDDNQYTTCQAFKLVLNEINDLAGQHEVVAENLQSSVLDELTALIKDVREDRKKHLTDGAKMSQTLVNQVSALDRSRKTYERAFREAERAKDAYRKADDDLNLSRAEVEKFRSNMTDKSRVCENAKSNYAKQLQETNQIQKMHYFSELPHVLDQLQHVDEKRIKYVKNFIMKTAQIERDVFPIVNQCLDGIVRAADCINEKQDGELVIEKFKSGFQPPDDFPFEDLSRGGVIGSDNGSNPTLSSAAPVTVRPSFKESGVKGTVKGTLSANKLKKRIGLLGIFGSNKNSTLDGKDDYSDLPPNQRRKRLQAKCDELDAKIVKETETRDGLLKMKSVYETNPSLGDPTSVEGQLNESNHRVEKLKSELNLYQGYLAEAIRVNQQISPHGSRIQVKTNGVGDDAKWEGGGGGGGGGGGADVAESLSRSASDSSVANQHYSSNNNVDKAAPERRANNSQHLNGCSSNSPESGLGTSHTSLHAIDSDHEPYMDEFDCCDADRQLPLGTCKAVYPFVATSDGSIPIEENESLLVIEEDTGDGWTKVRRTDQSGDEGFVPTSYIEITLYPS